MQTAVFIGRFQPVHKGHIHALKEAAKKFDEIIIILGSPTHKKTINERNPLTTKERIQTLKIILKHLKYKIKIQRDVGINRIWKQEVESKIPDDSIIVSGNSKVLQIFSTNHKTMKIIKKIPISATRIRKMIRKNDAKWKSFIPKKAMPYLKKFGIEGRLRNG